MPRRDSNGNPLEDPMGSAYDGGEGDIAGGPGGPYRLQSHEIKMEDTNLKFPNERTPRNLNDLNFSPSWMDPNGNMNMMSLAAQHPGFYTPNSAGMGAIFHSQAGDLHTPTLGMNTMTPMSLNSAMHNPHPAHSDIDGFNQPYLAHQMHDMSNPFMQQQSYAPSAFMQREPASYEMMDESVDESPMGIPMDQASNVSTMSTTDTSASHNNPLEVSYAQDER